MHTDVYAVEGRADLHECLKPAATIIKNGGTVAFPTETVYGLGANALDASAVQKIFDAKRRPPDDPLIVHVSSIAMAARLVDGQFPVAANELVRRFWPGPLTLVFKKSNVVPGIVTSGLPTVAIRMPVHPVARVLIELAGVPVAAPSANLFERPSPTRANHVLSDLGGRIDAIVDGGHVDIGVESTILDVSVDPPVLLRPGGIPLEALEASIGKIVVHENITSKHVQGPVLSPGMKSRHYAPITRMVLVDIPDINEASGKMEAMTRSAVKDGKKVGLLLFGHEIHVDNASCVQLGSDPASIAKALFETFRLLDTQGLDMIISGSIEERGLGLAIMNRLRKAAIEIVS